MNAFVKIKKYKAIKRKIVCLTAYSRPIKKILDKYCDIILVETQLQRHFTE